MPILFGVETKFVFSNRRGCRSKKRKNSGLAEITDTILIFHVRVNDSRIGRVLVIYQSSNNVRKLLNWAHDRIACVFICCFFVALAIFMIFKSHAIHKSCKNVIAIVVNGRVILLNKTNAAQCNNFCFSIISCL